MTEPQQFLHQILADYLNQLEARRRDLGETVVAIENLIQAMRATIRQFKENL